MSISKIKFMAELMFDMNEDEQLELIYSTIRNRIEDSIVKRLKSRCDNYKDDDLFCETAVGRAVKHRMKKMFEYIDYFNGLDDTGKAVFFLLIKEIGNDKEGMNMRNANISINISEQNIPAVDLLQYGLTDIDWIKAKKLLTHITNELNEA